MATEQFFQEATTQNGFNKATADSISKWKSLSEEDSQNNERNGFDCNICLDNVNDPVVTLCGHLYCWPCIYKWIHYQNTSTEHSEKQQQPQCPVCKSEVSQQTLIPLYGRGQTLTTKKPSPDVGMYIPRRPASPRCGVQPRPAQQLPQGSYPLQQPPRQGIYTTTAASSMPLTMSSALLSPTAQMFGEMVYGRIFGNSERLFTYPNSYNLAGMNSARARRHAMETDRSLNRLCFFFFCCLILCLLLF